MIVQKHHHVHNFVTPRTATVRLSNFNDSRRGVLSGTDVLQQRACQCGKVLTYDLQRKKEA